MIAAIAIIVSGAAKAAINIWLIFICHIYHLKIE